MRLLATLLLAALPLGAYAQGFGARPDIPAPQGAFIVPQNTPVAPIAEPAAPPPPPPPTGLFQPLQIQEPTLDRLLRNRSVSLNRTDAQDLGTDRWAYTVYESGQEGPKPTRAIVALMPPGSDAKTVIAGMDLRAYARNEGWRLIMLSVPQTQRVLSGTLDDIAQAQRNSANDAQRIDRVLSAVLSQERAAQAPAIIATEGAGNGLLALLCGRTGRSSAPSHAVVMGGALDTQAAAACQPSRVPALLIARSTSDTSTPYGGGEQAAVPGQPQPQSNTILSAAGTRGLWALLARCRDTEPTLTWLPSDSARVALETHGSCSAGGPVGMLTALDGATVPTGDALVTIVESFLRGELL